MKILKCLSMCLGVLAVIAVSSSAASAAARLTPQHLYRWADENNTARLHQFKRYINLQDNDKNTALCLAQQAQNREAYSLLLKFGASTKVSCHDDDDPICAIIAGEKTKVSPAGLLLLGAGAAAGAYLLLDDDDGDKCKVADYPLDTCPEHGHCSKCKDKNRLDYCDEFWTPNPEHTQCIPVPCPEGEVTACPVNEDFVISSTPTSSKSGDEQCYTCAYACKTGEETCPTGKTCTPVTAPDGTVCQQNPQCPTGYTETTRTACETANPGYYCEESAPGSGCWKKDDDNFKQCTPPAVTANSCPAANTGFVLTETPTGEKTGPDNCVTCNYACDIATGYYTSQTSCETASGKVCGSVTQGGTTCWLPGTLCPTTHPYTTKAACEAASGGYACVESAAGSNCWGPGTAPLTCPADHPSETACVKDDAKYVTTEDIITYGGRQCYSCTYACKTGETTCPTGKTCTDVATPDGTICKQNPQCPTGYAYATQAACETANPGYTCANSGADDCWKPQTANECPAEYPERNHCTAGTGYVVTDETSIDWAGGKCFKCEYACDTANGYLTTCPTGKICTPVTTPAGICQTNPQCPTGYTETTKAACETANPGYYCEESAPGSGCWKKDEDNLKQCTPPAVTKGNCPDANTGFTLLENPNGEMSGTEQCVTCNYACDIAGGYYGSQSACETASGKTCTGVTQGGTTCWLPSANCPTSHPYTTKAACEAASGGYACVESAAGSNCWGPGTTPLTCPASHPSETACPKDDTKYVTTESTISYGGRTCYNCAYSCRPNETTCPTGKTCTAVTAPDGTVCQQNPQCPTDYAYASQSACETANPGYTCVNSGASDCWKPGTAKQCTPPAVIENTCTPAITGLVLSETPNGETSGTSLCVTCNYACNTAAGYYTSQTSCETASGKTCTSVAQGGTTCWLPGTQCPASHPYTSKAACEAASGGYACVESAAGSNCWGPGSTPLTCPASHPRETACPRDDTKYITTESTISYGGRTCYNCAYSCRPDESTCPTGKTCTAVTAPDGTVCQQNPQCPSGYSYASQSACETANPGYTCTNSGASDCWKPDTAKQCPTGYETTYQSVNDCGSQAENGWKYESNGMSGDKKCGKCTEIPCAANTSTTYSSAANCPTVNNLNKTSIGINGSYSGQNQCYQCVYTCNESTAFAASEDCTDGGWTCTRQSFTTIGGTVQCYVRSKAANCPTTHPSETSCVKDTRYVTTQDSITYGGRTCYSCAYACKTGETTCPTGKTCTPVTTPDGTVCQQNPQCPTDYAYSTQTACETANPGYTCVNSGATDCWKPDTAKSCPTDYSTTYQSVEDCGSRAENGWIYTSSGTSGGLKCGKCEEKPCRNNTSTSYDVPGNCPTVSRLSKNSIGQADDYYGETQCYKCIYTCDSNQGAYTREDDCNDNEGSCKSVSISTISGNVTCYISSTSTASADVFQSRNTTLLTRTSSGNEDVYGLSGSTETLKNTTSAITSESGRIEIAHNSTGKAYGMFAGADNSLVNDTGASIAIKNNAGGSAYGMYAAQGGTAINRGSIRIDGADGTAYGIYGEGQNTIENTGTIDVSGHNAYGIYVKDGSGTDVLNTGTITVNAANEAHGIFIDKNSADAVVSNQGTIVINGETKAGQSGITLNGAKLKNFSRMRFMGNADLNAMGGDVYLEKGGTYEADTLSGDMNVGVSTVMGGNQDTYANTSALVADNIDNLNLASESALFTAETQTSEDGKSHDVIMTRKNFAEFAPNASVAEYLEANYKEGYLESAFDGLKAETDDLGVSKQTANKLGYDTMLNFADENFTALKSLNRNIADTILKPTDEENRVVAGYDNINWETDGKGLLSGADLSVNSMYTFGDKRLDNYNRLGLGLSFTKLSSDYDVGGDRDLNIVSIFMPYMHKFSENLRLASVLSVGYGWGEYDRGSNKESDITDIFYGLTNELRYTINLNGFADLEPALMLNALGYYEDGFDEGDNAEALQTKKTHNTSVEAGIGLFLKKEMATEKYGKFGFKVGGAYYHELASPYDSISARNKGANGMWYRINDYANLYSRDRAVLEAMVDYEYKNLGVYAKYNRLLQKNDPQLFDLGIKYKF